MGASPVAESPTRIHASSVLVAMLVIMIVSMLAPPRSASAATPLPAGTYEVQLGSRLLTIEAATDGRATLDVPEDVVVKLSFDGSGRVLNEALVTTPTGTFEVAIEVFGSGSHRVRVDARQNVRIDLTDDLVMSTVATCTPSGLVAATVGLPNHGTTVSQAASGMHSTYTVSDPVDDVTTSVVADFRTLRGAREYCDAVELAVPTVEEIRAFVAEQRARALGHPAAAEAAAEVADRAGDTG